VEKMPQWHGNPDLGFDCFGKKAGMYEIYVFGKSGKHKEKHQITDFSYCVSNLGSGMFKSDSSASDLMGYVDLRIKLDLLTSGRNLTEKELLKWKTR
jgi:hypothetical protein